MVQPVKNNLVLELHVPSFQPVYDFYQLFGFEQLYLEPVTDSLGYLVMQRQDDLGKTLINFYGGLSKVTEHSHFKKFFVNTPRGYAVEITIPVADIDQLWAVVEDKLKPKQIAQPLAMKRWGKRDFRVIDPFGFYVRFAELVDWGQS
ncbi:MAG: hypothetical protein NTV81_02175 [Candidatus Komeilibacteria bacterium]|nr:hypothetical protein [Candidatus Komeilibacteria bacterium]